MNTLPTRLALGAVALLAGCAVGPDYVAPSPSLTADFAGHDTLAQRPGQSAAPALDEWWRGFDDPVLCDIVDRALVQNLDLSAAMARVDQARAIARQAGAIRRPQGSLQGQDLEQRQSLRSPEGELARHTPGYERGQNLQSLGAGASWELDLAGALSRNEEAAIAELQAAEASRTGTRISVAAEAADAYFRIRGAQRRLAVADEQIRTQQNLASMVGDRLRNGLGTNREQAQAQSLVLQAKATLPPLRTELALQLNRLDVLMGVQPGTQARRLTGDPRAYTVPAISADLTPADLLRRRPDVIAAERRLAATSARIGVATDEYYPHVSIGGLLGVESLHGGLFTSDAFQPQALLGLRWRLFDFGRVDAEVAQAKGANAQALAEYRLAMLRATEDVEDAIVVLSELEQQRIDVDNEVQSHEVARAAAQDAYRGGAVSLVEVLDEDRALLTSRDQLAQIDADDARAAVAMFRAFGGGWRPAGQAFSAEASVSQGLIRR